MDRWEVIGLYNIVDSSGNVIVRDLATEQAKRIVAIHNADQGIIWADWVLGDNGLSIFDVRDDGTALIYVYNKDNVPPVLALPELVRKANDLCQAIFEDRDLAREDWEPLWKLLKGIGIE